MNKILLILIIISTLFSCERTGFILEKSIKKTESNIIGFPIAINYDAYPIFDSQRSIQFVLRKNYFDSTNISTFCINPLKSEEFMIKTNDLGKVIEVIPKTQNYDSQFFNYNNIIHTLQNTNNYDITLKTYNNDLNVLSIDVFSIKNEVKNNFMFITNLKYLIINDNNLFVYGTLGKNNSEYQSFFAQIIDNKITNYQQFTSTNSEFIQDAVVINEKEIMLLTSVNLGLNKASSDIYVYSFQTKKLENVYSFRNQKNIKNKIIQLSNNKYIFPTISAKMDGNFEVFDLKSVTIETQKINIGSYNYKSFLINEIRNYNNKNYANILLDDKTTSYIVELKDLSNVTPLFEKKYQSNYYFFRKFEINKIGMIVIENEQKNGRSKILFNYHRSLNKVDTSVLYNGVQVKSPCYN